MKKLLLFIVIVLFVGCITHETGNASELNINWKEHDQALAEASASGKQIFIYFYMDYCRPCKLFENNTLADSNISEMLNEYFLSVKVNINKDRILAKEYRVRATPTIYFLDEKGKVINYSVGYISPNDFSRVLNYMKGKFYEKLTFDKFIKSYYSSN